MLSNATIVEEEILDKALLGSFLKDNRYFYKGNDWAKCRLFRRIDVTGVIVVFLVAIASNTSFYLLNYSKFSNIALTEIKIASRIRKFVKHITRKKKEMNDP